MWQIMCGYLIVVKIVIKTRLSCKCYTNGQKMNVYILITYIIHSPFGDIMLNHNLWLDVGCNFIYVTNVILIINVGWIVNCSHKLKLQIGTFLLVDDDITHMDGWRLKKTRYGYWSYGRKLKIKLWGYCWYLVFKIERKWS